MDEQLLAYFEDLHDAIYENDEEMIEFLIIAIITTMRERFLQRGAAAKRALLEQFGIEHPDLISEDYQPNDAILERFIAEIVIMLQIYVERIQDEITALKEEFGTEKEMKEYILGIVVWQIVRFLNTEYNDLLQGAIISATKQIADDNNMIAMKRWIAVMDNRTCPICRALHGTELPIDEPFMVNGAVVETEEGLYQYDYIPRLVAIAHPNDRCTIETFLILRGGVSNG